MAEEFSTLENATLALVSTAERAAALMRQEAQRAREESMRTRTELENVRTDVLAAKEDIEDVRGTIMAAGNDVVRVRKNANYAWGAVGVMGLIVVIAVGWTAAKISRSGTEISYLTKQVDQWKQTADQKEGEISRVRSEAEFARISQARAEGALQFVSQDKLPKIEPNPIADARPATAPPAVIAELKPSDLDEEIDPLAEIPIEPKTADEKLTTSAEKTAAPTTQPTLANVLTSLLSGK